MQTGNTPVSQRPPPSFSGSRRCVDTCPFSSLSLCGLTDESCRFLASALNASGLRELDLSYNHLGDSGPELLAALLDDPQCSLQKVRSEALACC